MSDQNPTPIESAAALSTALKDFHRALIRAEVGDDPALNNPYTMLFALIGDPRFAWMGVLSQLITRIDEAVASEEGASAEALGSWRGEAAAFLGEGGENMDAAFRLRHLTALQKEPEVGLATGRLRSLLRRLDTAPD